MVDRPRDAHGRLLEQLGVYALGKGTPSERAFIGAHVDTCPSCRSELAQLASTVAYLARMRPDALVEGLAAPGGSEDAVLARIATPVDGGRRQLNLRNGRVRPRLLVLAASVGSAASGYGLCWFV